MQPPLKTARYAILDNFRGILVLSMVAYHTLWDMKHLFGADMPWYGTEITFWWQQSICWSFILLSGFCFPLSHRKWQHGLLLLAASTVVSGITLLIVPNSPAIFGILFLLGSATLLQIPLDKLFCRWNPWAGLALTGALFVLTYNVNTGSLGFLGLSFCPLPDALYQSHFTAALGFPHAAFLSSDYFSLIPWVFLYQAGYFLHGICKRYDLFPFLVGKPIRPLAFAGRHSLLIYMLHQPLIFSSLWLFFRII